MRRPFQKELIMMNGSRLPKPPRRPSHLSPFVDSMEGQVWCFKSAPKKNAPKTHMFDTNKKTLTALWGGKSKYFWPISSGNQTWFAGKDPFSSMFCTFEPPFIGDFPGASWAGSCSCPCQVPLTCGGWGYMKQPMKQQLGSMEQWWHLITVTGYTMIIYNDIHHFTIFLKTIHHISPHFTTFHLVNVQFRVLSHISWIGHFSSRLDISGRDPGVTRNGSSSARSCASSGDDFTTGARVVILPHFTTFYHSILWLWDIFYHIFIEKRHMDENDESKDQWGP